MLGHLGINGPDLRAAKSYHEAFMPLVGFELYLDADDEFAYRPAGGKPKSSPNSRRSSAAECCTSRSDLLARPLGRHVRSGVPSRP